MHGSMRFIHCLLILYSAVKNGICAPLEKRQVVQPKWLTDLSGGQPLIVDSRVHVGPQNLKEAAAIRASINKAVKEDTFAVQSIPSSPATNGPQRLPPITTTPPPAEHSLWDIQLFALTAEETEAARDFMLNMQRAWDQFNERWQQLFSRQ